MKTISKTLIFICFFITQVYAQQQTNQGVQTGDPNELDEKFVPDKNSILNSANNSKTTSSDYSQPTVKNIIKFNLALLGRSTFAIAYEHPFGNLLSVEGALGVCFGQDYMLKSFAQVGDAFNTHDVSNQVKLSDLLSNSSYSGSPSPFLSAGLKLYFSDEAPEGSYVHFNMRYSTNNLTYTPNPYNGGYLAGNSDLTIKNLGFNLIYGYQIVVGSGKGGFVQDLYAGFGIRHTGYTAFNISSYTNTTTGNYQQVYSSDGTTRSVIQPILVIGYCLGFGF